MFLATSTFLLEWGVWDGYGSAEGNAGGGRSRKKALSRSGLLSTHGGSVHGDLERRAIRLVTRHRHRQSRHRFQGPSMWAVAGRPLRFGAKVFALQTTLRIVAGFVGLGRLGGVGVGGGARPWRRACAKQRRGDCGEEIVEARLLQRSWSLRSSWRPSSIFEMELVAYESATKLKALEFNRRKRR